MKYVMVTSLTTHTTGGVSLFPFPFSSITHTRNYNAQAVRALRLLRYSA